MTLYNSYLSNSKINQKMIVICFKNYKHLMIMVKMILLIIMFIVTMKQLSKIKLTNISNKIIQLIIKLINLQIS